MVWTWFPRCAWTWALLGALIAAEGCAPARARPPEPDPASARSRARGIPAADTSTPSQPFHPLDPSEEITSEELASIPEPVPSSQDVRPSSRASRRQANGAPVETSSAAEGQAPDGAEYSLRSAPSGGQTPRDGAPGWVWRVQVFASEDLRLADRKAKEATERLQIRAHIEFETPYYKVRLGDFATEVEAQTLRERAIQAGYLGAFRTRCAPDTTQYED